MKSKRNAWPKAIGFTVLIIVFYLMANLMLSIFAGVVIGIVNAQQIMALGGDTTAVNELMMESMSSFMLPLLIIANLTTLGLVMLVFLARKDKFLRYVRFNKVKGKDLGIVMVMGVFLNLMVVAILSYVMRLLPNEMVNTYSDLIETLFQGPLILVFLTGSVVAPLFEEIILRGVVFNDFRKATSVKVAIVIQALLFGLMHWNIVQSTYAFILGIIFGVIYLKYKSIWMPIMMHFTFNTTSLLLDELFPYADSDIFYLTLLAIGAIGTAITVYLMRKNYISEDYEDDVTEEDSLANEEMVAELLD